MMDVLFERDDLDVEVGGAPEMEVCLSPAGAVVPAGQTEDAEISGDVPEVLEIELTDAPVIRLDIGVTEIVISLGGEGGAGVWGSITGDLADQTDLAEALAGKADRDHDHDGRYYTESEMNALLAGKASVSHDHDGRYYTESEMNALLAGKSDVGHEHDWRYYKKSEMDGLLAGKSDVGHDHDGRYYTESETDELLAGKSDVGHDHDGRYYTESETDGLLAGKSDTGHDHDGRYYTNMEVNRFLDAIWRELAGKAVEGHNHDERYYTETEVNQFLDELWDELAGKAAADHDHDGRYYTESEIDLALDGIDQALAGKADVSHTHDDRYYTESETDTLLAEKAAASHDHDGRYYTESETDALLAGKSDAGHDHDGRYYTESETDTLLAGKADSGHNHDSAYSALNHVHDDRYYTESETDALLAGKSDSGHDHDGRYYTEAETDTLLAGKSDTGHTHSNYVQKAGDTMTGSLNIASAAPELSILRDGDKIVAFKAADGTEQGAMWVSNTSHAIGFRSYDNDYSHREIFYLPSPGSLTANATYYILTTKTPVTLAQGGTGGTDSEWQSYTDETVFTGTVFYRKVGAFFMIMGQAIKLVNTLTAGRAVLLVTLPPEYKPSKEIMPNCFMNTGLVNNRIAPMRLTYNGVLYLYANKSDDIESTYSLYFSGFGFV